MSTNSLITLGNKRIDRNQYKKIINAILLKITKKYVFPPEIIQVKGVTIGTLGNFSASVGKPKSKKTFNVSALTASALSGIEVLNYKVALPDNKKKILYIDTEQSNYHCHKVLSRILKLADLPTDKEPENLRFLMLREYTPEQRRDIINYALEDELEYGLVIIDGLRDLIRDINNPGESNDIINDLMRWSSHYQIHIHTVLHLNKGDDNVRGHIGTELNNKAETIIQVTKDTAIGSISEVKAMHIRDKEFAPFAFEIDTDGLPQLVGKYNHMMSKREKNKSYRNLSEEQHRKALDVAFHNDSILGYNALISAVKRGYDSIGYTRGRNTLVKLIRFLLDSNVLIKFVSGYGYNENFKMPDK